MSKFLLLTLALLALLAPSGCSRQASQAKQPPDYLIVTGIGRAEAENEGPGAWAQTLGGSLTATASADIAAAPDGPEALLAARAEARRQALRRLAEELGKAPAGGGQSLAEWLADAPAAERQTFELLLEEHARPAFNERQGRSIAMLSLPTSEVAGWLQERAGRAVAADATPAALNRRAYDMAVEQAKASLREQLLTMTLDSGQTFEDAVERRPALGRELDGRLWNQPVDEINYPRVGVCEVKIYFDRNVVRDLAHPGSRWRRLTR